MYSEIFTRSLSLSILRLSLTLYLCQCRQKVLFMLWNAVAWFWELFLSGMVPNLQLLERTIGTFVISLALWVVQGESFKDTSKATSSSSNTTLTWVWLNTGPTEEFHKGTTLFWRADKLLHLRKKVISKEHFLKPNMTHLPPVFSI